jgi:acyl-CoA oxidase
MPSIFALLANAYDHKASTSLLVDFWRLSTVYSHYLVIKNFHDVLNIPEMVPTLDVETMAVLQKLFDLYALNIMEREGLEFVTSGATTLQQIELIEEVRTVLYEEIRPHAVKLVDAWKFPDWQLDSSLGRYDGKVYVVRSRFSVAIVYGHRRV